MKSLKDRKSEEILKYFANKEGGRINRMKAMKLIWLSDRLHLREYGRPVTSEKYYAMKNGPIPSHILDLSREMKEGSHNVVVNSPVDIKVFSKTDLKIMDLIYENFGSKNQFYLSTLSHLYPEWKKHESHLNSGINRCDIDEMDFFLDPNIEDDFFALFGKEKLAHSQELYVEYKNIANL